MRASGLAVVAICGLLTVACQAPPADSDADPRTDTIGAVTGGAAVPPAGEVPAPSGNDDVRAPATPPGDAGRASKEGATPPTGDTRRPPAGAPPPPGNDGRQPAGTAPSGDRAQDERTLRRLEEEVRRLARQDGCERDGQCAAHPVGAKACGGPRFFVTYCPVTTNVAALRAKADELHRFEQAYNRRYEIVSDCALVMEPPVGLQGGRCVARQ